MTNTRTNPEITEETSSRRKVVMPEKLGRYKVIKLIGEGGFGSVFEGFDEELKRKVAIKIPLLRADQVDHFDEYQAEAQNLARLQHQGIVSVFDIGADKNRFYIVTELLDGVSLHKWMQEHVPTWQQTAGIVAQIADALAHAHARKVVHRDIKPGNIIMTPDRGPVLVDFGLSLAGQHSGDEIGCVRGTLRFMAPEQIEGRAHRIDGRTDIYSLGVIFYRLLTGSHPFQSKDKQELRRQILFDAPQPPRQLNSAIPESMQGYCLRAISKTVSKRYSTAADLAAKLHRALQADGESDSRAPESSAAEAESDSVELSGASRPAAVAGRRHVTIMHITASVRAIDQEPSEFDPEDQLEAMELLHTACSEHAARFGGSLLPSSGQDMLICFGYPLGYEDASRRAAHAGLEIQDAIERLADDLAARLQLRLQAWISIHSGIVIASGPSAQTLVGDTLTLVTKIDRETSPGIVAVTADTHRLIRHQFQCEELDASCRAAGETLALYRVLKRISHDEEWSESDSIKYTPLVGRDQEVSMLIDRWQLVGEGFGQLVALIGDAGLGKSRLVHVLRQHVHDACQSHDPPIIEWSCSPYHVNSAFYPAKQALQQLLHFDREQADEEKRSRLKHHLQKLGLDLPHTLPVFCELLTLPQDPEYPAQPLSSPRQKELTLEYLYQWFSALAQQRPTLFIVEDLHWIDPSTLDFLQRFADEPIADPLMCLLTFRPEFSTPWTSRAHQTQIALNRLTRSQVSQIITSKVPAGSVPSGVIERVVERTDGVPLFVEEYAKMLHESPESLRDAVDAADSTVSRSLSIVIPRTLQDLLMARLDRIGGEPSVVRLAATLGREFSFAMLAAAAVIPKEQLAAELEKLVESELLFRRGTPPHSTYIFKHALIQDAAYDSMLRRQRREMHQCIADALQNSFPETIQERPEVLARHRTEADQDLLAVPLWEAAGSMATARGAFVEAVQHLQQAMRVLQSLSDGTDRDELEYKINVPLGIATLSLKGYAAPELGSIYDRRMELCEKLNDPMGQLHAKWASASWRIVRDEVQVCLGIGDQMIGMAQSMDDDGAMMEALFIQAIGEFYHGDFRKSLHSCQRGWDLFDGERCLFHASRLGQHAGVAHLSYMALNHWYLGQPASALRRMSEALELAESLDHPFSVAFALHHFGWLHTTMENGQAAAQCANRQIEVSREQAFFFWETTGMLFRGGGQLLNGNTAEAYEDLTQGLARYQATGAELALPQYHSFLAQAQINLGEFDSASATLDQAIAAVAKSQDHFYEPEIWRLKSKLAEKIGDKAAEQHAQHAVSIATELEATAWQLKALLQLAKFHCSDEMLQQIRVCLDGFESCGEEIPMLSQARQLLGL